MERALGGGPILQVGGTRVARADQGEDARAARGGGLDQRLQRVPAQQRVGGEGVGVRPVTGPQGVGVSPTNAWA